MSEELSPLLLRRTSLKKMELQPNDPQNQSPSLFLDSLYCEEEKWDEKQETVDQGFSVATSTNGVVCNLSCEETPAFWEDEELLSLFSREEEQLRQTHVCLASLKADRQLAAARSEAVEWILKVNAHYGFTALTAILAIDYLQRFLSSLHFQREYPWIVQLVAVTCLSLAAKVEEIQVPLLLDLQVEGTKFVFEAKTIQKMELLVLSSLQWRMHPVTPLSFLDHIVKRLGFDKHLHWEFIRCCESLLLSLSSDSRSIIYLPSVIATATIMNAIEQLEGCSPLPLQTRLLNVLNIARERVEECYKLIKEVKVFVNNPLKRKERAPRSPSGVIDGFLSLDSSNDSWLSVGSSSSSVYSSPEPPFKKSRGQDQQMRLPSLLNRVFIDIGASPP